MTADNRPADLHAGGEEYAAPNEAAAARCLALLVGAHATVAVAESLTAGLVCGALAGVPGASAALRGGLVAYASDVKIAVLGVSEAIVAAHGVVSAECARAMADQARVMFAATWGLATTGVAGPDAQEDKAPGTVFVAVAGQSGGIASELSLTGSRQAIRQATVAAVLELLASSVTADQRACSDR